MGGFRVNLQELVDPREIAVARFGDAPTWYKPAADWYPSQLLYPGGPGVDLQIINDGDRDRQVLARFEVREFE